MAAPELPDPAKLEGWARLLHSLTPRSIALLLVLGSTLGVGYAVWEARATLLPRFLESTAAVAGAGVGVMLVMIGLALMDMYTRLEARAEAAVQRQAEMQRQQIEAQSAEIQDLRKQLAEVRAHHTQCQAQVSQLALLVAQGTHAPSSPTP